MQFHRFKGHFTFFAENAEKFFGDFIGKNAENKVLRNLRKKSGDFDIKQKSDFPFFKKHELLPPYKISNIQPFQSE